jgi:hypothetical protein
LALGLVACGVEPVGTLPPPPEPEPAIQLAGAVTMVADAGGNARYLGEVKNGGDAVACSINLSINSFDADGRLLNDPSNPNSASATCWARPSVSRPFVTKTQDTRISPGNTGSFDIRTDVPIARLHRTWWTSPAATRSSTRLPRGERSPLRRPARRWCSTARSRSGRRRPRGLQRDDPQRECGAGGRLPRQDRDDRQERAGLVADVAGASMDDQPCPLDADAQFSCVSLTPLQTWSFTVPLSIPPSATCPGCFSFHINQKMVL